MSALLAAAPGGAPPAPAKAPAQAHSLGAARAAASEETQLSVKKGAAAAGPGVSKGQRAARRRKRAQLEGGGGGGGGALAERAHSAQPQGARLKSAGGAAHQQLNPKPAKTTRVRINSTSEQIEDPNWLQQRLHQQQRLGGHLRQLQHKFRLTITGGGGGGQHDELGGAAGSRPDSAPSQPPSLPATPAKVPVSILKRRSRSPASSSAVVLAAAAAAEAATGSGPPSDRSPRASHRSAANNVHANPAPQASRTAPLNIPLASPSSTVPPLASSATNSSAHAPAAQELAPPPQTTHHAKTIVPLCAEGQVKVSGWRRKNLLAKTLGHLDEIRGNQMPVFVPTKIRLPSEAPGSAAASSGSKFVDVVRQAMATKRTTSTPAGVLQAVPSEPAPATGGGTSYHQPPPPPPTATSRVCPSLSTPEAVPSSAKRSSISEMRAYSADPSQQLHHAGHHAHLSSRHQAGASSQHRSSSAGLGQAPPGVALSPAKQQVIPGGGQQPTQQQAVVQRAPRQQHLVVENSARLYKLAHKNQQLLHNLRRQSNEHQPSAVASLISATRTGTVPDADKPTAHLKDWKRLASKLALLTTGGRVATRNSLEPGQLLRVSVSNDEASSNASSTTCAHSDRSLLLAVPFRDGAQDSTGPRKLSSSSMFAQRTSCEPTTCQPRLSSDSTATGRLTLHHSTASSQRELPRRSSDSEAYKRSSMREYLEPEARRPKPDGVDETTCHTTDEPEQPAVVVRGDDLIQLLQVASTNAAGSTHAGPTSRRSLQLDEKPQIINNPETERKSSTHSMESLVFDNKELEEPSEPRAPLVALTGDSNAAVDKQPSRRARREQLSSLVKKTTKVVFLQEKLRKIRWRHLNRGTAGGSPSAAAAAAASTVSPTSGLAKADDGARGGVDIVRSDKTELGSKVVHPPAGQLAGKGDAAEVLMDPTLIGDAIEIFLRSSMQNRRPTEVDVEGAEVGGDEDIDCVQATLESL